MSAPPGAVAADSQIGRGIILACLSAAMFSAMSALVKEALILYPLIMVMLFRTGFGLAIVVGVLSRKRALASLRTTRLKSHLFRGLCGVIAIAASFTSYQLMPLADATAIGFTAPLFITALSAPFLGERVGAFRWTAVIVGFLGVLIMARPGDAAFGLGALFATIGSLAYAFAVITMRQLTRTDPPTSVAFYNQTTSFLFSVALLPWFWTTPAWGDMPGMIGVGLGGGVAQLWMARAIQLAPVAVTAPFNYTQLVWAVAFGYVMFAETPNLQTMAGAAVVCVCGLFILLREGRA